MLEVVSYVKLFLDWGGVGVGREQRFTKTELIRKKRQHCLLSSALKSFSVAKQLKVGSWCNLDFLILN